MKRNFQEMLAVQVPWSEISWMQRSTYLEKLFVKIVKEERIVLESDGQYVDLGCGDERSIDNIALFSRHFSKTFYLDVNFVKVIRKRLSERIPGSIGLTSDAQKLPFKDETFSAVSAFSLIEHLPKQEDFLKEVSRILKKKGIFIMQFPNRDFFVELHNGMFMPGVIPRKCHFWIVKAIHRDFSDSALNLTTFPMNPSKKQAIKKCGKFFQTIIVENVNYPEYIMPKMIAPIYALLKKLGLLNIIPMGYLFVCIK
ncbi:class I SAM-dependent methyltransferase [Candidatus Bathyarchaeota archaeon]|nr:class I SAM-dependent methyltransferase [Candidatus Bathyarchaeota archaeon]